MFTTKGGLKKKNSKKMGFQSISDMIQASGTTFSVLTVTSLMGFMIVMNVVSENYEYFTHNDTLSRLDVPVTKYLLKFSIVDDDKERGLDEFIYNSNDYEKESDTKRNFFLEAQLQKALWINSISSGRVPICPSVANISFFKDNANNLLEMIVSKAANPEERAKLQAIKDYLIAQKNKVDVRNIRSIGLITQNLLTYHDTPARTLESVLEDGSIEQEHKKKLVIYAAAQVLRLYLDYRAIHCDLHLQNFLVTGDQCFIIDFGRVYNFLNEDYYPDSSTYPPGVTNVFPSMYQPQNRPSVVRTIDIHFDNPEENIAKVHDNFIEYIENTRIFKKLSDEEKSDYIKNIFLDVIVQLDLKYQQYSFGEHAQSSKLRYLIEYISFFDDDDVIYYEIYEKYLELSRLNLSRGSEKITVETIDRYIREGNIEKFDEGAFLRGEYDIRGGKSKKCRTNKRNKKCRTNKRNKKRRTNKRH